MLFSLVFYSNAALAHHLVPRHDLSCSVDFPCPKELQRRIDFWVEVFKTWDKEKAIFHDPDTPERVYGILETGEGCGRGAKSKIDRYRKQLKSALYNVADDVAANRESTTSESKHLRLLFDNPTASQIKKAGDKIRCQSGVNNSFIEGLKRFKQYHGMVDQIMQEVGLPSGIRYLPFVESSYNPTAYSKAGAAGMWQIMPSTARVLGLEISATLDERLDPEAATRAAAKYLLQARESLSTLAEELQPGIVQTEVNPFIITSYNYGVNGMRRAMKEVKPNFLNVLNQYKSAGFQVAVKNFYASFLAASHVAHNADQFFGDLVVPEVQKYKEVLLVNPTSIDRIKRVFSVSEGDLRLINPALTRFVWHSWRLIPSGYRLKLPFKQAGWDQEINTLLSMAPESEVPGGGKYTVRKGDSACAIAQALRVSCRDLIDANQLGKKAVIRIGQKLVIPTKIITSTVASVSKSTTVDKQGQIIHTVKRGDTACTIAERYGVSCKSLISLNQLGRKAVIYRNQKLLIPGSGLSDESTAVLTADKKYVVRKGDSVCLIAERLEVSCSALRKLNQLNSRAVIFVGQKLSIPGQQVIDSSDVEIEDALQAEITHSQTNDDTSDTEMLAESEDNPNESDEIVSDENDQPDQDLTSSDDESRIDQAFLEKLLDKLPDVGVVVKTVSGNPAYQISAESEETLGHYSDWLGLGSTRSIRDVNNIKSSNSLQFGQKILLPIDSATTLIRFEQKRTEYHQVLSEELKEHFDLVGISQYQLKSGDSAWSMSNEFGFPMWLLYRLNPQLRNTQLSIGSYINLPDLQEKQ